MTKRAAGLMVLLVLVSGCAERWQKPGASQGDFEIMKADCMGAGQRQYPPLLRRELVAPERVDPLVTQCTGAGPNVICSTRGGGYHPPTMVIVDDNQDLRDQAIRACFFAHGWVPAED